MRTIDIRPGVSVLAVLRHLNYKPWYALAEFVDNSVQSYLKNRLALQEIHGCDFKLIVNIDLDLSPPARISIRDNAAGIFEADYCRAFRPAAIPPDRSGLAEFGMGMKSAACWFAPTWSVRTSALGESLARTVRFNIENIVNDDIGELTIDEVKESQNAHYTEITLESLFHVPAGRTIGKLKEHLTDIYREFIRRGILDLRWTGEKLSYTEPEVLRAAYYRDQDGEAKIWRKSIEFDLGNGMHAYGFAALREIANTAKAGFALFRRGRVIQGSGEEGYRPAYIFGSSNSYRYQRLFGELHLEGFDVSHTKDGFRWDENEQPFLELLRERLDSEELPLLKQAEGFRVRLSQAQLTRSAQRAVENTAQIMQDRLAQVVPSILDASPSDTPADEMPNVSTLATRQLNISFRNVQWCITVELTDDRSEGQWLAVNDVALSSGHPRRIGIRVSTAHPFMVRFAQADSENLEALLRVAAAMAVSEVIARDSGVRMAGTVRRNVNDILREALSEP